MKTIMLIGLCVLLISCTNNYPECYLTTKEKCIGSYDRVLLMHDWSILGYHQCCKKPHYVLQGIEPTIFTMKNFCEAINNTEYWSPEIVRI